jgi:hypothetical protein
MAFDLGLVEDAYTAALSNPQHDLAEENIRRLVLALLEQGEPAWAVLLLVLVALIALWASDPAPQTITSFMADCWLCMAGLDWQCT